MNKKPIIIDLRDYRMLIVTITILRNVALLVPFTVWKSDKGSYLTLPLLICCKLCSPKMTDDYASDGCLRRGYDCSLRGRVIHEAVIAEQVNSAVTCHHFKHKCFSSLMFVTVFVKNIQKNARAVEMRNVSFVDK